MGIVRRHPRRGRPRGMTVIYVTATMTVMFAFISLGVDLGRVQLAKTELQRAADAAARYGALGIEHGLGSARSRAIDAANDNSADGTAVALASGDVRFGLWNPHSRNFTPLPSTSAAINAMEVTASRTAARDNAVPLLFGRIIGMPCCDVRAVSIAVFNPGVEVDQTVPASANPWLAGMPNGTQANPVPSQSGVRRDRAGNYTDSHGNAHPNGESPVQLNGIALIPGAALTFDAIGGTGGHGPTQQIVGPDGNTARITDNDAGAEHGKSNVWAPIDAVMGIFLDDSVPSGTPPPTLDFSTGTSREFTTMAPRLRQVFFIGDGRTSGGTAQQFMIPPGATRLFIGKMDGYEWNNNVGQSTVRIRRPASVSMVR